MKQTYNPPEEIPVTAGTLGKIKCYADLMGRMECYGILLSPADANDGIVYDAMLAGRQRVSHASAGIDELAAAKSKEEIERAGYKAVGFWHSHAGMGAWHSATDDENFDNLVLDFAGNTERKIEREIRAKGYNISRTRGGWNLSIPHGRGTLEMAVGSEESDFSIRKLKEDASSGIRYDKSRKILYVIQDRELLTVRNAELQKLVVARPKKEETGGYGTGYSIVVSEGEFYGEMAIVRWCNFCNAIETKKIKKAPIKIIRAKKDVSFAEEELREEIRRKVKC